MTDSKDTLNLPKMSFPMLVAFLHRLSPWEMLYYSACKTMPG